MKYKQQAERRIDTVKDKLTILDRMVSGHVPTDQRTGLRILKELREEVEELENIISLER